VLSIHCPIQIWTVMSYQNIVQSNLNGAVNSVITLRTQSFSLRCLASRTHPIIACLVWLITARDVWLTWWRTPSGESFLAVDDCVDPVNKAQIQVNLYLYTQWMSSCAWCLCWDWVEKHGMNPVLNRVLILC